MTDTKLVPVEVLNKVHRLAVEFNPEIHDIDDTLSEINQAVLHAWSAAPVVGEPVAWTHDVQMNKLRNAPKEASAMWGQPNGSINLALYTHPDPKIAVAVKALEEARRRHLADGNYVGARMVNEALAQIKGGA